MRGRLAFGACLASALFLLGAGGAATAATIIKLNEAVNDAAPKSLTMLLDADRMRLTSASIDVIFRGDQNVVWVLQQKDHRYLELTPGGVAKMGATVNLAMSLMKQKLAGMPDAQRKQVEAMMGSHGLGEQKAAVAAELTYEKAGDPRKVGEWDCTPYRIVIGGKPTSDLCVAKLADVGLSRDDLKPFVSLGAFAAKLRGAMGGLGASMAALDLSSMTKALGFDGFPVETSSQYREGHRIVTTLVSVEHQDAPAGAFDVPADYKKREMPDLGSLLAPK